MPRRLLAGVYFTCKEAEEAADLQKQEESEARKRGKEQHQTERAKLEQQKRVEKEMRLATERPIVAPEVARLHEQPECRGDGR